MDASEESSLHNEAASAVIPDEFASGNQNRLRQWVPRLVNRFFSSPYLPAELTWLLLCLIVTNSAFHLIVQPAAYWVDFSTSTYYSFLGIPLKWGLWAIGAFIGYLFLVALILGTINIKPAFALWLGLCVFHLVNLTELFHCRALYYVPFESSTNCASIHELSIVAAGLLWGTLLTITAQLNILSRFSSGGSQTDVPRAEFKHLRLISMGWIGLLILTVALTAVFTPKPVWRSIDMVQAPPGRTEASLVYDTRRSVAVLFGGSPSWTQDKGWESMNDTWEWNGNAWTNSQPLHTPLPRYASAMAFDEARGISVLFGGIGHDQHYQSVIYGDTWEWNGEDWIEVFPATRPPARQDAAMFFDPLRGKVVLYGGYYLEKETLANVFLDDAWEWDGKNWQQIVFDAPRRNSASAIAFDPIRQLPLLIDAEGLWLWQDTVWAPANFAVSPAGRWGSQLAFHPEKQQMVLFGGFVGTEIFDDTWTYNGETWKQIITKVHPPHRSGHNLFYDPVRKRVVLFGGLAGGTFYGDMWELIQP